MPAIIDNNVLEFADNDAIRLNADAKDVELTNNTFAHNLWSNVQKPEGWVTIDDKTWSMLSDFGWKKLSGNQVISANLPLDKKFFDIYLSRTAYVPGKVTMDDWNQLREVLGQPMLATGGQKPEGLMPAYDWKSALAIVPKNPKVKAGARPTDIPVHFGGATRQETSYSYTDTTWDAAKNGDKWDSMQGQRVALKVAIKDNDGAYNLPDVKSGEYQAFMVVGPQGIDSGGQPMRVYVKKGTTASNKLDSAKRYSRGEPDQTYTVKGVARSPRQMVVEVIEPAE